MTRTPRPAQDEVGAVLAWGDVTRRDLPWRRTRDPWAVLVSEVMLAQTQVARVEPRWRDFLSRWPTPGALVAVSLGDLLIFWKGLGYPRRAAHLQRAATCIESDHHGRVPDDLTALLALPGVGPYTARAVLVFAFESDVGVVDTNIARVLARYAGRPLTGREAQEYADAWVPSGRSWEWNQTLMDVGAMLCRPTHPGCEDCPLAPTCAWNATGGSQPDPAVGSAGVSTRQARFEGSDRQGRGRILGHLSQGSATTDQLINATGWSDDRARFIRAIEGLCRDGLVVETSGRYGLPH